MNQRKSNEAEEAVCALNLLQTNNGKFSSYTYSFSKKLPHLVSPMTNYLAKNFPHWVISARFNLAFNQSRSTQVFNFDHIWSTCASESPKLCALCFYYGTFVVL